MIKWEGIWLEYAVPITAHNGSLPKKHYRKALKEKVLVEDKVIHQ